MRRKKDDKRVLRSGNGRQNNAPRMKLRRGNKNNLKNRPVMRRNPNTGRARKKRKSSKTVMAIMIIALIAFVIGAGIGVSLSFDTGTEDEGPHYENVTKEMTSNLNDTEEVYYEKNVDDVDFNQNQTSQLNDVYTNVSTVET